MSSARMSAEVASIASKIAHAIGCATCGTGIAIDIVGQRWGEPPYDWAGQRFGHACTLATNGLTPEQAAAVTEIIGTLHDMGVEPRGLGEVAPPMADHGNVAPAPPVQHDPRLPPENDDDEGVPF